MMKLMFSFFWTLASAASHAYGQSGELRFSANHQEARQTQLASAVQDIPFIMTVVTETQIQFFYSPDESDLTHTLFLTFIPRDRRAEGSGSSQFTTYLRATPLGTATMIDIARENPNSLRMIAEQDPQLTNLIIDLSRLVRMAAHSMQVADTENSMVMFY